MSSSTAAGRARRRADLAPAVTRPARRYAPVRLRSQHISDVLDALPRVIADVVGPAASEFDRNGSFAAASIAALDQLGVLGFVSAAEVGSGGAGLEAGVIVEKLAAACGSTAMVVLMQLRTNRRDRGRRRRLLAECRCGGRRSRVARVLRARLPQSFLGADRYRHSRRRAGSARRQQKLGDRGRLRPHVRVVEPGARGRRNDDALGAPSMRARRAYG